MTEYSTKKLKEMWSEFADTPINDDEKIELDFYEWKAGTDRLDIWHWFDEKLPNGLAEHIDA